MREIENGGNNGFRAHPIQCYVVHKQAYPENRAQSEPELRLLRRSPAAERATVVTTIRDVVSRSSVVLPQ